MSATLQDPDVEDLHLDEGTKPEILVRIGRIVHYAGMPVFLAVALGLFFLWLGGQDLDSISRRAIAPAVLWDETVQHVWLTVLSTFFVLLIAIPLGIAATRSRLRRYAPIIIGLGNAGLAIPSLGMLGLVFFLAPSVPFIPRTGTTPTVLALVAYSFLPILRNTMVGLDRVDQSVLEAGRGMGMSNRRVLRRIELPLAVPVILAGIRTALVLNTGTAALAYFIGGGGLGNVIIVGANLGRTTVLWTGAILVAALALLIDYVAGLVEETLTPKGL